MNIRELVFGTAALVAVATAGEARALTFALTNTGGAESGTLARQGFDVATRYWSSVLTDNVTVNLNIGFRTLGTGILGSTGSARALLSMSQGYDALAADRSSALDGLAVAGLQPLGASTVDDAFGAVTATADAINPTDNGYLDAALRIDDDGSVNNSTLAVTKASAKALGIRTDVNEAPVNYASADGSITFSDAFAFDFNPTDGIASNAFDFIGVAIHEIGHALGFVSGVDSYDGRTAPGAPVANQTAGTLEDFVVMSQLDLFRYGAPDTLDWSTQGTPYFSIDSGSSQLFGNSLFSTGTYNGDGRQASHWKDSPAGVPQLGILDPTSGRGQLQEVTALDLAAYDAIGWNVGFDVLANSGYRYTTAQAFQAFATGVPEPAVWLQMLTGFTLLGGALRYRRRRRIAVVYA